MIIITAYNTGHVALQSKAPTLTLSIYSIRVREYPLNGYSGQYHMVFISHTHRT